MSGIGGVLYFEPRSVDEAVLRELNAGLAHLGRDERSTLRRQSIGLVHHAFHTTPESRLTSEPFVEHGLLAGWDGRLDNRSDLARALGRPLAGLSDVALTVAAYQRWGTEAFTRLHGDFALALWDSREQTLCLVRDPFGVRRLFYAIDRERVIWASVPDAIARCPGVGTSVDERYVASFLALCPEPAQSPFQSVAPVLPGQVVAIRDGVVRRWTFWDAHDPPSRRVTAARRSTADYVDEFRDIFRDAVAVRLRADAPVLAHLSGGLDSSSIVCMADEVARRSNGAIAPVTTLACVWDGLERGGETHFQRAIDEYRRGPAVRVYGRDDRILDRWADPDFASWPRRDFSLGCVADRNRALRDTGARVVLCGLFGDELLRLRRSPWMAAGFVRGGRFRAALSECAGHSTHTKQPIGDVLWEFAVRPNLPLWMRRCRRRVPEWIDPHLAHRTDLAARLKRQLESPRSFTASPIAKFPTLPAQLELFAAFGSDMPTTTDAAEARFPFLHRPLVEFLMSLPYDELVRPEGPRAIQRDALAGLMPDAVRLRQDKGGSMEPIIGGLKREWDNIVRLLDRGRAVERGYVDGAKVRAELARWKHGLVSTDGDVLAVIALEMWLRALDRRPHRAAIAPDVEVNHAVA